jgi:hypothetical protein
MFFGLATANRFLHACEAGLENGMVSVSDGIRHSENARKLERLLSTTNERAFGIGTGYGQRGRYSSPVVLLTPKGMRVSRRSSENNRGRRWQERRGGR